MGHRKSSSSSKPGEGCIKSSKGTPERTQMLQRSHSNPVTSSSSNKEPRPSGESLDDTAVVDDDNNDDDNDNDDNKDEPYGGEEEAGQKSTVSKRHSNLYTECGRHGDDWLFGGIAGAVKSVFKKNEK
jgi:hypothetical protein